MFSNSTTATYYYEGRYPKTGQWLRLPRTQEVEAIAQHLMQKLSSDSRYCQEGKMYGVLLVENAAGKKDILKAFSGLLNGESIVEGWVPPIPGRKEIASAEAETLQKLENIKNELLNLDHLQINREYQALIQQSEIERQQLSQQHQHNKQKRQNQRLELLQTLPPDILEQALEELDNASRKEKSQRRKLKEHWDEILQPLQVEIQTIEAKKRDLKQQRKTLSRQLQIQMHATYSLTNFAGESLSIQQLVSQTALPTGTGDCCAPKLLHYAATQGLKPLALAEFWWGKPSVNGDKIPGQFYGACVERCQPIMGFLLSGLSQVSPELESVWNLTSIFYEDESIIAVDKPSGLLSVPGRYSYNQDSILTRLQNQLPQEQNLMVVHRLDQETSGILLFAKNQETYLNLSQQFQQRQIQKTYQAILGGEVKNQQGVIDLPLWGNPAQRPRQAVNREWGKPSITKFRVIAREGDYSRLEFQPITGRTHQLRVHSADAQGLGVAILGDRLYGCTLGAHRLHLHAATLSFQHPQTKEFVTLQSPVPF